MTQWWTKLRGGSREGGDYIYFLFAVQLPNLCYSSFKLSLRTLMKEFNVCACACVCVCARARARVCVCVCAHITDELGSLGGLPDVRAVRRGGVMKVVFGVTLVGILKGFGKGGTDCSVRQ